jgi:hypothetical protein
MNEAWTRTSRDRWAATRDSLIKNLAHTNPGKDVTVYIGGMPCGFFIWDEATSSISTSRPGTCGGRSVTKSNWTESSCDVDFARVQFRVNR